MIFIAAGESAFGGTTTTLNGTPLGRGTAGQMPGKCPGPDVGPLKKNALGRLIELRRRKKEIEWEKKQLDLEEENVDEAIASLEEEFRRTWSSKQSFASFEEEEEEERFDEEEEKDNLVEEEDVIEEGVEGRRGGRRSQKCWRRGRKHCLE